MNEQLLAEALELLKKTFDHFTKSDIELAKEIIDFEKRANTALEGKEEQEDNTSIPKDENNESDQKPEEEPKTEKEKGDNWPF